MIKWQRQDFLLRDCNRQDTRCTPAPCYHPRMRVGNVLGRVCLSICLSVCPSLCLSVQTITFEPLHIGTSFVVWRYILTISRSSLSIKVIGSRSSAKKWLFTYFNLLFLCMYLQAIKKVKVTYQVHTSRSNQGQHQIEVIFSTSDWINQMCYCCRKLEKLVIFSEFLEGRGRPCSANQGSTAKFGLPHFLMWPVWANQGAWPPTASHFGLPRPPNSPSHGLTQPPMAFHFSLPIWPPTQPPTQPLTRLQGAWPPTASQFGLSQPLNSASHMASHTASNIFSCDLPEPIREHSLPQPPTLASHGLPILTWEHGLPIRPLTASQFILSIQPLIWPLTRPRKLEKLVIFSEFLGGRTPWLAQTDLSQSGEHGLPLQWEAMGGQIRPPTFSHVICLSQSGSTASHSLPLWPPTASHGLPHGLPIRHLTASQFGLSHGLSHGLPIWPLMA